ncbi:MAG: N-acetyl-gamma-glutamyl-phosphate reductase [Spirochaetaceae bacterium]|jgi:N-acetyl-gamma-glutamyl-phosphate reductase|nr:N-acetyl-gamma-glutamyl-phosphate reductase [Spirochaetaceae bacterium]
MVVGIIGATGYTGVELIRLLLGHPAITGFSLASASHEGSSIEQVYPHLLGLIAAPLKKAEEVIAESALVFAALPTGVGEEYARLCFESGIPYIDLSADFRFGSDEQTYEAWYGMRYRYPNLHSAAVYGLPELNRKHIRHAKIIGNPGCYPTGATLGIMPALAQGMAHDAPLIIDAASGVTGSGRELSASSHYPQAADSLAPYKVGVHRHIPEISRIAAVCAGRAAPVIFTPHLAPLNRGILSTIYIPLAKNWQSLSSDTAFRFPPGPLIAEKLGAIKKQYEDFYRHEPFIRVLPDGLAAATNRVRASNFCDISLHLDSAGSTLIVVSAIDNMVKGACGQAIQNMNIIFGLDEKTGLGAVPSSF